MINSNSKHSVGLKTLQVHTGLHSKYPR